MRVILVFAVALCCGASTARGQKITAYANRGCSLDTPYAVYDFDRVAFEFLESLPQLDCDDSPIGKIIKFNCMRSNDSTFHEVDFRNSTAVHQFNKYSKWGFIVHGFLGDCYSDWPLEMLRVWTAYEPINICCLDWNKWAKCNYYIDATKYVFKVGGYLANIIKLLTTEHNVNISDVVPVGHSFGGIIVGQTGKYFKNPQLPLCIALDPAGYAFTKPALAEPHRRLHLSDCKIVKTIITEKYGLGSIIPMGSINIYANNGADQPMCRDRLFPCSHFAATTFFIESIRANQTRNYPITSIDGRIKDYWTLYANDIPGNYTMTTGPCYPYSIITQPRNDANETILSVRE